MNNSKNTLKLIVICLSVLIILQVLTLSIIAQNNWTDETITDSNHYFYLPEYTDITQVKLNVEADSYSIKNGDKIAFDNTTLIDLTNASATDKYGNSCYEVTFFNGDDSSLYTIYLLSELPNIFVGTSISLSNIESDKNVRDQEAKIFITDKDGNTVYEDVDTFSEIKGRGNATFSYAKKPYQIKLATKTDLFDMGKSKTWILLANYMDASFVRNAVSYKLAEAMELPFTPKSVFVNLYINNQFRGLYQLIEKTQVGTNRIEITDLEDANELSNPETDIDSLSVTWEDSNLPNLNGFSYVTGMTNPDDITGGYLVELDNLYGYMEKCRFTTGMGNTYVLKSPECASREQVLYIAKLMSEMEEGIYAENGKNSSEKHFSEYVDVESLYKVYMVGEMTKNWDIYVGSTYFYKDVDVNGQTSKIYSGPVWDYDHTYGNLTRMTYNTDKTELWAAGQKRSENTFGYNLIKHEEYSDLLDSLSKTAGELNKSYAQENGYIDTLTDALYDSAMADRKVWGFERGGDFPSYEVYKDESNSADTAVGQLTDFMTVRANGLEDYFSVSDPSVDFTYVDHDDTSIIITGYTGKDSEVTIPDTINGKTVYGIATGAFTGPQYTKITLPLIQYYEDRAIYNCPNLVSLYMPKGDLLGNPYFVEYNSILHRYDDNTKKEIVYVADGFEGDYVFYTSFYKVGADAFDNCSKLTTIVFPTYAVTCEAGVDAFENCTSLTNIYGYPGKIEETIAQNLGVNFISLNDEAYFTHEIKEDGTVKITNVNGGSLTLYVPETINGKTVTELANGSMHWKPYTEIHLPKTLKTIQNDAFRGVGNLCTIVVDEESEYFKVVDGGLYTYDMKNLIQVEKDCTDVFTVPSGVETLYASCFYNCTNIETVNLPDTLKEIGMFAFRRMRITHIDIPSSVTMIDSFAFQECTSILHVILHDGLISLGDNVFENNTNLSMIVLPNSLQEIGDNLFKNAGTTKLYGFEGSLAQEYASKYEMTFIPVEKYNDFVYRYYDETKVVVMVYDGNNSEVVIPETLNGKNFYGIASYTFTGPSYTKITLPKMYYYEGRSIYNCPNLAKLEMPGGLNSNATFIVENNSIVRRFNSNNKKLIYVPNGISGDYVILQSTMSITNEAFHYCDKIKTIVYPSHACTIDGGNPFYGCSSLKTIYGYSGREEEAKAAGLGVTFIPLDTNQYYSHIVKEDGTIKITDVSGGGTIADIPETINGKTVTELDVGSFYWKTYTQINIPKTIQIIRDDAFRGNAELTTITVDEDSKYFTVVDGALYSKDMKNLILVERDLSGEFTVPNGVEKLYASCFVGSRYTIINLPNTLKEIGMFAFRGSSVISLNVPSSVETIREFAFFNATQTTELILNEGLFEIYDNAFEGATGITSLYIPESIKLVGSNIFKNSSITTLYGTVLSMGESLANINQLEFIQVSYGKPTYTSNGDGTCYVSGTDNKYYHEILINKVSPNGDTVISIGDGAFSNSFNLKEVTIPNTITSIGNNVFGNDVSKLTIRGTVGSYAETYANENSINFTSDYSQGFEFENYDDGITCAIKKATCTDENIVVPKYSPDGRLVTMIEKSAFNNLPAKTIELPDGLAFIGVSAFENCNELKSITIPSSVKLIEEGQFMSCPKLENIIVDNRNENYCDIDGVLFSKDEKTLIECPPAKSGKYGVPYFTTKIANYAFANCTNLTSIKMYDNLVSIGNNAFLGCNNITSLVIPNGVTRIGDAAFKDCSNLLEITIPATVNSIGTNLFENSGLKTIKGYANTKAHEYAEENNYSFVIVGNQKITIDTLKVSKNNPFNVKVTLNNCPGITTAKLKLLFDNDILTLENVTFGKDITGQTIMSQTLQSPFVLNWINGSQDLDGDLVFATLTFKAKENVQVGTSTDITVECNPNDIANVKENSVIFNISNGTIEFVNIVAGDINGDNYTDNKDLVRFFKYLSMEEVQVVEEALDTNGDGKVNNKDLTRLFQYISEWDVKIYTGAAIVTEKPDSQDNNRLTGYENVDFGGKEFKIVSYDEFDIDYIDYSDFWAESNSTNVIDQAVYERNQLLTSLYNCKLNVVSGTDDVLASIASGELSDYFAISHAIGTKDYFTSGKYYNVLSFNIDYNQPWWNQNFINDLTSNGKLFGLVGDYSVKAMRTPWVIYYNKDIFEEKFPSIDINNIVKENKWTFDTLLDMVSKAKTDVDNDGTIDVYGLTGTEYIYDAFYYSSGLRFIKSNNGKFEVAFNENAQENEIAKIYSVVNNEGFAKMGYQDQDDAFLGGNTLFASNLLGQLYKYKNSNFRVGVLPCPLYSEGDDYNTFCHERTPILYIPTTVENIDIASDFLTLFAYHSSKIVKPAFLEDIKSITGSDETKDIVELILKSRMYDPGYYFDMTNSIEEQTKSMFMNYTPSKWTNIVNNNKTNILEQIEQYEEAISNF